jgi:hypothetical protein
VDDSAHARSDQATAWHEMLSRYDKRGLRK